MAQPHYQVVKKDEARWVSLAKMLIARGLDGGHYVKWMYDFYTTLRPVAYPKQIASPKSLQIYLQRASYNPSERLATLRVKVDIQLEVVRQQLSLGRTLRAILEDTSLEIGPVIRYVLAHRGGLADLACGFRAEAERAIGLEPLYKTVLGDKLPEGG